MAFLNMTSKLEYFMKLISSTKIRKKHGRKNISKLCVWALNLGFYEDMLITHLK